MGHHFHSGSGPNDNGITAHRREVRLLLSKGEEILPFALERLVQCACQDGRTLSPRILNGYTFNEDEHAPADH